MRRVIIVCGERKNNMEDFAIEQLCTAIEETILIKPEVMYPSEFGEVRDKCDIVIAIGRPETNSSVNSLLHSSFFELEKREEGYALKIGKSELNTEGRTILVSGADDKGTLYGAMDFIHHYLQKEQVPEELEWSDAPKLNLRGGWIWCGNLRNYKTFLDNMARWKLNNLVVWSNDTFKRTCSVESVWDGAWYGNTFEDEEDNQLEIFRAVQDHAKKRGIRILWGSSWGWTGDTFVVFGDKKSEKDIRERILKRFELLWEPLGVEGLYFQTNTEFDATPDVAVGKECVEFLNPIIEEILSQNPNLFISAGIHYGGIKGRAPEFVSLDKRSNVLWEGWKFYEQPFYYPFFRKLMNLRGEDENVAFMVRVAGADMDCRSPKLCDKAELDRIAENAQVQDQALWSGKEGRHFKRMSGIFSILSKSTIPSKGLFLRMGHEWSARQYVPTILAAEMAWNPERSDEEITSLLERVEKAWGIEIGERTG